MKKYRAVLFDLFGTVALFDREKLPVFEWNGQTFRSTMGLLRGIIEERIPQVPFEQFFAMLSDVSREIGDERARNQREISSIHRFSRTLHRVGYLESSETQELAEQLSRAHMRILTLATAVPDAHVNFLAQVTQAYATALVSNFDHGPTAHGVLRDGGVTEYFQHIVVSDDHGWRKPHPKIFTSALSAIGVDPVEALFVGDSPEDDIVGAKMVGMDMAWVNAQDVALPPGTPTPDYEINAIPELRAILFR